MTYKEIQHAIDELKTMVDDEKMHVTEDYLHYAFIRDIAQGTNQFAKRAQLILTTNNIDFHRLCA